MWMYVFALAYGLVAGAAGADVGAVKRHSASDKWPLDPLLPGEPGDDGTREGLFGQYFEIPLRSTSDGQVVAHVMMQLAITSDEDHHGLMFRRSMPENNGMIFLYTGAAQRVLYMRNTYIDLDAGWFAPDGTLLEVQHLNKLTETWRWSKSNEVQWGVEMNVGWFKSHGIEAGKVKLDLQALANAITARGFDPSPYGLPVGTATTEMADNAGKLNAGNTYFAAATTEIADH